MNKLRENPWVLRLYYTYIHKFWSFRECLWPSLLAQWIHKKRGVFTSHQVKRGNLTLIVSLNCHLLRFWIKSCEWKRMQNSSGECGEVGWTPNVVAWPSGGFWSSLSLGMRACQSNTPQERLSEKLPPYWERYSDQSERLSLQVSRPKIHNNNMILFATHI